MSRLSNTLERIRDLFGRDRMSNADRAVWASCRSLADVGFATSAWLDGVVKSQPGYCGPVDVDEDEAPGLTDTLIALNRAGMVTADSQAGFDGVGYDGARWTQYAAVSAFAPFGVVASLSKAIEDAGLAGRVAIHVRQPVPRLSWRPVLPVTFREGVVYTDFGRRTPDGDIRDEWVGYGICHPSAVEDLCDAEQITIYDIESGRNDRLWPLLRQFAEQAGVAR